MPADAPSPTSGSNPAGALSPTPYVGRFAPSPTGSLHFGSLVSALASYLDARHHRGKWLVRMEDLDPPREKPGAAAAILRCLEDHGLEWDDSVVYQSQRGEAYEDCLQELTHRDLLYPCDCTRQDLQAMGGLYNGQCRHQPANRQPPFALRLKCYDLPKQTPATTINHEIRFTDVIQGEQFQDLRTAAGDQILKRKDGLYAYQLAVVVDDIAQGITRVIRGSDLLDITPRQIFLFQLLGKPVPTFGHVTLACQPNGQKLSKQNLAPELNPLHASQNLWRALKFMGQNPPAELQNGAVTELLDWAVQHWQITRICGLNAVYSADDFS